MNENEILSGECLIIAGGKENNISRIYSSKKYLEKVYVIACDKGCDYALKQGIPVNFACGDFDSASELTKKQLEKLCNVEVLPTHKDDTDLIHGIKHAVKLGFRKITVTCAGGGRYDHFISNIQALVFAKTEGGMGCEVSLYDDDNEIFILADETRIFDRKEKWSLTVLSFSNKSEGVTITGAEYEVQNALFTNKFPLGQSNGWKNDKVTVSVSNGILIVIMSKIP